MSESSDAGPSTGPVDFALPPTQVYASAVSLAKRYLDGLATEVSAVQESRAGGHRSGNNKRKRGGAAAAATAAADNDDVLRIKVVHTDGFGVEQIWEQARRVIDAAAGECERDLEQFGLLNLDGDDDGDDDGDEDGLSADESLSSSGFELDGSEVDVEDEDEVSSDDGDSEADLSAGLGAFDPEDAEVDDDEESAFEDEEDSDDDDAASDDGNDSDSSEKIAPDVHGLNDRFFSIDEFNRQTQMLERQDTSGNGDDDDDNDDDDDVNWDADPFSEAIMPTRPGKKQDDESDSDEEDEDEDGPTFGDVDLDAPEGASDIDDDGDEEMADGVVADDKANANNIMYTDFYVSSKKPQRKNKKGRPHPHNFPAKQKQDELAEDEGMAERQMEHAMNAVRNDLFDDADSSDEDEEGGEKDGQAKSSHERRQGQVMTEIRRLEAEAVAKRHWTLQGEAKARDRPMNSLLEEDMDFERAGKPLPVVTPETNEDIEALIKRRILNREFDEVIRRRPDEVLAASTVRRGKLDGVDDRKSGKSLAELYEDDHLRKTDPNYVDDRDEALKAQHAELDGLWRAISADLDSLSNWHYRPKPTTPNVEIRVDAAAMTIEDARPAGVEGIADSSTAATSMLAPQEIYKLGQDAVKKSSETTTRGGMPVAVDEMDRDEKKRRRRRAKERIHKANGNKVAAKDDNSKEGKKKRVVESLTKAGVKVIGKKGELRDVAGREVAESGGRAVTSAQLML